MKGVITMALVLVNLLSACGVPTPTQESLLPSQANPTETLAIPTSTVMVMEPSSTPTATVTPQGFGAGNFSQFVQIQVYSKTIEDVFGLELLSMRVDDVAYSADGRYVAIGGCTINKTGNCQSPYFVSDSFLMILDSQTGEIFATLPETEVSISSLAFTGDSEKLVYAVNPVRIVVWDLATREVERTLWMDESTHLYPQLAISPDDSMIAAAYANRLMVWRADGGDLLVEIPAGTSGGYLPQFSANGNRLAVFTRDDGNEITIYDTSDWSKVSSFQPGDQTEIALFSPDGEWIITAEWSYPAEVLFWDVESGAPAGSLGVSFDWVYTLTFSPDGRLLLVSSLPSEGNYYEGLGIWDFAARKPLGFIYSIMSPSGIQFSTDGSSFLMDYSPFIYRWSLPEGDTLILRQAVLEFLDALASGNYATAEELFQPADDVIAYFESLGLESADPQAVYEFICNRTAQSCTMPLKEILYEGKNDDGSYTFLLTFMTADGLEYVDDRGETFFWLFIKSNEAGGMTILSLPSFLYGS
jgi:WD40 repeat protein